MQCIDCVYRIWGSNKCINDKSKYHEKVAMATKDECKEQKTYEEFEKKGK